MVFKQPLQLVRSISTPKSSSKLSPTEDAATAPCRGLSCSCAAGAVTLKEAAASVRPFQVIRGRS